MHSGQSNKVHLPRWICVNGNLKHLGACTCILGTNKNWCHFKRSIKFNVLIHHYNCKWLTHYLHYWHLVRNKHKGLFLVHPCICYSPSFAVGVECTARHPIHPPALYTYLQWMSQPQTASFTFSPKHSPIHSTTHTHPCSPLSNWLSLQIALQPNPVSPGRAPRHSWLRKGCGLTGCPKIWIDAGRKQFTVCVDSWIEERLNECLNE